jgi:hypothetical protein
MRVRIRWGVPSLLLLLSLCTIPGPARVQAQDKQHVVSLQELNRDTARPAESRQADEAAVRQLFSSQRAQDALKGANLDYAKVNKAIGQLSDADVAKLAERSRHMESNFAAGKAGSLSDRDLLVIIIVAVLLIALIAVLR